MEESKWVGGLVGVSWQTTICCFCDICFATFSIRLCGEKKRRGAENRGAAAPSQERKVFFLSLLVLTQSKFYLCMSFELCIERKLFTIFPYLFVYLESESYWMYVGFVNSHLVDSGLLGELLLLRGRTPVTLTVEEPR